MMAESQSRSSPETLPEKTLLPDPDVVRSSIISTADESQQDNVPSKNEDDAEKSSKEGVAENVNSADPPADVVELCKETFQKTAEYLRGELDGTIEDYKLLEKMNTLTMNKYSDMKHIALSISGALKDLNDKYQKLHPYLEQIDQIEEGVVDLERAAYSLDQYSKRLETKFKNLERR